MRKRQVVSRGGKGEGMAMAKEILIGLGQAVLLASAVLTVYALGIVTALQR